MAPRVQRQRRHAAPDAGGLPTRAAKEESHTRQVFSHVAKTGKFWFCWRCGFYTTKRVKGLPDGAAEPCKAWAEHGDGRNPKDGRWLAEPTWHAVGRANVVQVDATEAGWDWRDAAFELERGGLGVKPVSKRDTNLTCQGSVRTWQFCWTSQVADAVPLIRTSLQKNALFADFPNSCDIVSTFPRSKWKSIVHHQY